MANSDKWQQNLNNKNYNSNNTNSYLIITVINNTDNKTIHKKMQTMTLQFCELTGK